MAAASTTRRTTAKAKPAPVVEPEVEEFEEDEFEDADDDATEDADELEDEADEAPAEKPKRKPPVRPKIEFGSPELAAHVTEVTGENYDARAIRMLLRKMANDGKLNRVVGEDKGRYEFSGVDDPTVKAVVKMVKSGEAKALKQAGLQAVKDRAAAKKAAAKAAPVEDEGDEMEEVDEAPKPRRRAASAKPAAPAKATPARRRAATAAK